MKKLIIFLALVTVVINMAFTLTVFRDIGFFSKYVTLGNDIIKDGLIGFSKSFEYSPLYSMFFSVLGLAFKESLISYALIINIISGINTALLMLITRKIFDNATAVISAIIYIFSIPFIIFNTDLLAAPLVILFNLSSIFCFLLYMEAHDKKYLFFSGLFLGLSVITRPNILIFAILLFIYLIITDRRHIHYFIFAVLLCIIPITILNYAKSGELVLVEDSGPAVFYSSNNYSSIGLGYSPPGVLHVLESRYSGTEKFTPDTMKIFKDIAEAINDRPLSIGEINSFYLMEAKKQIFGNFRRFLSLSVKRIWYALHFFSDYDVISTLKRGNYLERKLLIPAGFIIAFGIAGLFMSGKKHQKYAVVPIYLLSYLAFFSLFYVTERLRLPMIILLIPFASYFLYRMFDCILKKDMEKLIISAVLTFILILVLSYQNSDIKYRKEHTKPKFLYLNNTIMAFYSRDTDAIIENTEKILEIDPVYSPAWYYVHSALNSPGITEAQKAKLQSITESFSTTYQAIIDQYRERLAKDIYDLEAIKFVSSYNMQFPVDSEEFGIIPDMTEVMKILNPADPEIYYIESAYYARAMDFEKAMQAISNAMHYGILYSSYYKDSALTASSIFLENNDEENAVRSLSLLKNLFPSDRDFQRFIKDRNLEEKLGNFSE